MGPISTSIPCVPSILADLVVMKDSLMRNSSECKKSALMALRAGRRSGAPQTQPNFKSRLDILQHTYLLISQV